MPVEIIYRNGVKYFRWGKQGKLYKRRADAEKQGRAIEVNKKK